MAKILVIDDDRSTRRTLELAFSDLGHHIITSGTADEGMLTWVSEKPDLILLDLMLPDGNGLDMLEKAKSKNIPGVVIMITGHSDLDKAIAAMRSGAFDFIHKPVNLDILELSVARALSTDLMKKKVALVADLHSDDLSAGKLVGISRSMVEVHKMIGLASRGHANILITGESGTGKELVAKSIHRHASTSDPLIPVNCSAFVPTLLESELFGYEKGAFTGAVQSRAGRFEIAGKGTLFLDEIGDLDLHLQVKLLRVLQERTYERVGGNRTHQFEARVVAATHRNLEEMVTAGEFREDLFYRLKVIEINIPPLRARKEDIEPLTKHLLEKVNRELRREVTQVPQDVLEEMLNYDWPGNVRELENRITAGVMLTTGDSLAISLPTGDTSYENISDTSQSEKGATETWNRSLEDVEREHIQLVLDGCRYNYGKACEILGVSRPTLRRKMEQYGLSRS